MSDMERLKMFLVAAVAMCALGSLTGVFLASVHAAPGWYTAAGIFLAGVGTWRTLAPPGAGIRLDHFRSKAPSPTPHISPPKH